MKRRVLYVSGTRADFGLMQSTLRLAHKDSRLDVAVCATGMHLLPEFGDTVKEIEASGVPIVARIPVDLSKGDGASMARALGQDVIGMTDAFLAWKPDLVLLLGDRGEMLAGALAAIHLNVPLVHLHGGERSGTVDEPVRHAISKLAHYHFTATPGAQERLVKMGERSDRVFVTGAPGLDGLTALATQSREALCRAHKLDPSGKVALVVFHPVLQEADEAGRQCLELLDAVKDVGPQAVCLLPNADAGNIDIRRSLEEKAAQGNICLRCHMGRPEFASWLAAADVMVGNSSSGIIEAASFGLRVVNVGERQRDRERSGNVIDVPARRAAVAAAVREALAKPREKFKNVYGDGAAGRRIVDLLATLSLDKDLLMKRNAY